MRCPLCTSEHASELLRKDAAEVFLGGYPEQQAPWRLPCLVVQCLRCGHVHQPLDEAAARVLHEIYQSSQAQASTSTGVGQWGVARAERAYAFARPERPAERVLEIGSPNDYVLRLFRRDGAREAVGVDPSLAASGEHDGVRLVKGFFPDAVLDQGLFDCIVAFNVVEHIQDMPAFLESCRAVLRPGGALSFSTPNCQLQLEQGDPAVFMHEHVHYFTKAPLLSMLRRAGFQEQAVHMEADNIYVRAVTAEAPQPCEGAFTSWDAYPARLAQALRRFTALFDSQKTVLAHGASNSLNNILNWAAFDPARLRVTDNDPAKMGKRIAGVTVEPRTPELLREADVVVIIPFAFAGPIRQGYIDAGYGGEFVLLTDPDAPNSTS